MWPPLVSDDFHDIEAPEEEAASKASSSKTIRAAVDAYLTEVKATKGDATWRAYSADLAWFLKITKKHYVDQLGRSDVMALFVAGREESLNQKTINKRVIVMLQAMRRAGAHIQLHKGDWPRTVDKRVDIYDPEEVSKFFAACDAEEKLVFQTFLCTGFRLRELSCLTWKDINWKSGTLSVRPKPELEFTSKSYEERVAPVPKVLLEALRARWAKRKDGVLVFPPQSTFGVAWATQVCSGLGSVQPAWPILRQKEDWRADQAVRSLPHGLPRG